MLNVRPNQPSSRVLIRGYAHFGYLGVNFILNCSGHAHSRAEILVGSKGVSFGLFLFCAKMVIVVALLVMKTDCEDTVTVSVCCVLLSCALFSVYKKNFFCSTVKKSYVLLIATNFVYIRHTVFRLSKRNAGYWQKSGNLSV